VCQSLFIFGKCILSSFFLFRKKTNYIDEEGLRNKRKRTKQTKIEIFSFVSPFFVCFVIPLSVTGAYRNRAMCVGIADRYSHHYLTGVHLIPNSPIVRSNNYRTAVRPPHYSSFTLEILGCTLKIPWASLYFVLPKNHVRRQERKSSVCT